MSNYLYWDAAPSGDGWGHRSPDEPPLTLDELYTALNEMGREGCEGGEGAVVSPEKAGETGQRPSLVAPQAGSVALRPGVELSND